MAELNLQINKEKCQKCGACARACDWGIIRMSKEGYPRTTKLLPMCMKCQHCLAACPFGAINVFGKNSENSLLTANFVKDDDMLGLIKTRRSCRHYKQENVDKETLQKLKTMLAWVPTGRNNHGLHFALIEDLNVMAEFKKLVDVKLKKLSKFLPPIGPLKMLKKIAKAGANVLFYNAPHLIVACPPKNAPCKNYDPTISLSYFELYANTLGLGTLWCGLVAGSLKIFPSLQRKLGIPKTHKVGYVMLFGVPDIHFPRATQPEPCTFSKPKGNRS